MSASRNAGTTSARTPKSARPDLTHAEAMEAFDAFCESVGPKCTTSVHLGSGRGYSRERTTLVAYFQPKGYSGTGERNPSFSLYADSYRDLLAACEAQWAEHSDLHVSNVIREMALAIIAITADQGECSDAALRAKFDAADVTRYGDRACEQATAMASNGPFSIVKLAGANDAQAAA